MRNTSGFEQESIVYGCVKYYADDMSGESRLMTNRRAILALPCADEWPYLSKDMFTVPRYDSSNTSYMTNVLHFGASYRAIEYEWKEWLNKFEALLKNMYWSSAVVHLETELTGTHTFIWNSVKGGHVPGSDACDVRCEWLLEKDFS